jgi:GGDEF domain-containing protein
MDDKIKNEETNERAQDRIPQDGGGSSSSRQSATDADTCSFERKIIIAIAVLLLSAPAFAQQKSGFPQVVEIAQVESESDLVELGVFSYVLDGKKIYFLNVGTLGAGDKVLQIVSECLTNAVRYEHQVCRWGGDEFIGIIPGSSDRVLARLRLLARRIEHKSADAGVPITVSIGFADTLSTGDNTDISGLIANADQAMYQVKKQGKRSVVGYENTESAAG